MGFKRLLRFDKDLVNAIRRKLYEQLDQFFAQSLKRLKPPAPQVPFKSPTRFSLITVNFSTTYYLKLMLLTLCEQQDLSNLCRIVIVDNNSKDGGIPFLEQLVTSCENIHLVKNKFNRTHANGLRKGISYVEKIEQNIAPQERSNAFLICDTDIVFRNPQTVNTIGTVLAEGSTPFAGELRQNLYPYPEAQASFFAVRRDCYARPDIAPIVHHGAPAYFMQRSMWKAGLTLAHFPSNQGGYILHRGRSGVSATRKHHSLSAYSTVTNYHPHYMGVKNGATIWAAIENRYTNLLHQEQETGLLKHLCSRFNNLGTS